MIKRLNKKTRSENEKIDFMKKKYSPCAVGNGGVVVLLLEVDCRPVLETDGQGLLVLQLLAELDGFGVSVEGVIVKTLFVKLVAGLLEDHRIFRIFGVRHFALICL